MVTLPGRKADPPAVPVSDSDRLAAEHNSLFRARELQRCQEPTAVHVDNAVKRHFAIGRITSQSVPSGFEVTNSF